MKVEYDYKNEMQIGNIGIGGVFLYKEIPYIRIGTGCVDVNIKTSHPCLALDIEKNRLDAFSEDVVVKLVHAKLVVITE